jgi:hypothetical protein
MERLPYIDAHALEIDAPRERVWTALITTIASLGAKLPQVAKAAWGLEPSKRTGDWSSSAEPGYTTVGFGVIEANAPGLLVLRGGHRFSRYELRFEVTGGERGRSTLHAHTSAVFPGPAGAVYRTLVIGSGGHRFAVRRLLGQVSEQAATLYG